MEQIIAITNQKGGVGKSTTAHALGAGLRQQGSKILYVDMDAQGNLSYALGGGQGGNSTLEVLTRGCTAAKAIQSTAGGDLIGSSPALSGADKTLTQVGAEYRLREALEPLKADYDYILIDTPPSLGILTVNALAACTWAIIPAQADTFSLHGIGQLYNTISTVRQYCNKALTIKGILLTRHNTRAILSRDMQELLSQTAQSLGTSLFTTSIREGIAIKEAQAKQTDIYDYAPRSNAAMDYNQFVEEVLGGRT
jgi:chromosome partitioning protein